jgi:hypothetical protein
LKFLILTISGSTQWLPRAVWIVPGFPFQPRVVLRRALCSLSLHDHIRLGFRGTFLDQFFTTPLITTLLLARALRALV